MSFVMPTSRIERERERVGAFEWNNRHSLAAMCVMATAPLRHLIVLLPGTVFLFLL